MATDSFTLTIHMVSSLDGYIAKRDNSIAWFETSCNYEKGIALTDEETAAFLTSIDCYIMGARTYELAVELSKSYGWAYGDKPTIVLSNKPGTAHLPNVEMYSGDLTKLVNERLKPIYKSVWLVGGASVVSDFIRLKLADEVRVSILPIILGDGIPFFNHIDQEQILLLKDVTPHKTGMVELCYEMKKD